MKRLLRLSTACPVLLVLAGFLVRGGPALGQTPQRDLAVTDPQAADQDFAIQGEYLDQVRRPSGGWGYMGLQVVALGDGRFEGVVYEGGLPGAGWNRDDASPVRGETVGSLTELRGDQYQVTLANGSATLRDSGGTVLGRLDRIHRISPTQGLAPPPGAVVLFAGAPTEHLEGARLTDDGLLEVGSTTAMPVQDFRLHVEFRTPYMPYALDQRRGNSGVYIQRRYEVQILDSFGLEGKPNQCGGLYRQTSPDLNMCLPPLSWQTYDIQFRAARFDAQGQKIENARITVLHNGVPIHQDRELTSKTGAGKPEGPEPLPIHFQNHGNPVHFRNLWVVLEDPAGTGGSAEAAVETEWTVPCTPLRPACGPRVPRFCRPRRWCR